MTYERQGNPRIFAGDPTRHTELIELGEVEHVVMTIQSPSISVMRQRITAEAFERESRRQWQEIMEALRPDPVIRRFRQLLWPLFVGAVAQYIYLIYHIVTN